MVGQRNFFGYFYKCLKKLDKKKEENRPTDLLFCHGRKTQFFWPNDIMLVHNLVPRAFFQFFNPIFSYLVFRYFGSNQVVADRRGKEREYHGVEGGLYTTRFFVSTSTISIATLKFGQKISTFLGRCKIYDVPYRTKIRRT